MPLRVKMTDPYDDTLDRAKATMLLIESIDFIDIQENEKTAEIDMGGQRSTGSMYAIEVAHTSILNNYEVTLPNVVEIPARKFPYFAHALGIGNTNDILPWPRGMYILFSDDHVYALLFDFKKLLTINNTQGPTVIRNGRPVAVVNVPVNFATYLYKKDKDKWIKLQKF